MTRFWLPVGLCVVLSVPEPATFALLVFAAACLVVSPLATLWNAATRRFTAGGDGSTWVGEMP